MERFFPIQAKNIVFICKLSISLVDTKDLCNGLYCLHALRTCSGIAHGEDSTCARCHHEIKPVVSLCVKTTAYEANKMKMAILRI